MLIRNGWPPDVAFRLDDTTRRGFCVALGEMDGGTFNWRSMEFEVPHD